MRYGLLVSRTMLHTVAFMIQLSYQPAFDAAHCIFRFLRIQTSLNLNIIEFDKLRILDYYMLFPFRAAEIKLKQPDLRLRAISKQLENKAGYATLPSGEVLFERMKIVQVSAAQTMAEKSAIDGGELRYGNVSFQPFLLPEELSNRILTANTQDTATIDIIRVLSGYELLGKNGLKDRTELLEYRYDNV